MSRRNAGTIRRSPSQIRYSPELPEEVRMEMCERALEQFSDNRDPLVGLVNLLTDIRHWCSRHGVSLAEFQAESRRYFMEEITEVWNEPH